MATNPETLISLPASFIEIEPLDDIKEHTWGMTCACCPEFDEEDEILLHHAFDGREDYEEGRRRYH